MARAQADDADAFAALYDRHTERAFRVAQAICRDRSQAEAVVQEGFLAIWRDRANYRPEPDGFQAWAMRIIQTRAIDTQADADPPSLLPSLRLLPEAEAEVIVLAFYGELSCSEIAAQLDLPDGTVKGRMRLGMEKLRRQMDLGLMTADGPAPIPPVRTP